jgi:hypothetical protein
LELARSFVAILVWNGSLADCDVCSTFACHIVRNGEAMTFLETILLIETSGEDPDFIFSPQETPSFM